MRSEYLWSLLLFFPVLVVQTTFIPLISIGSIVPDLVLILLIFYTLRNNQLYGTALGFVYGFLFDIITGSLLGSAMLSKTLAGFTAGYFATETKRDKYLRSYYFSFIVLLCAVIDLIVYSFFGPAEISRNILLLFFQQAMLPGLYTAVISLIVLIFIPGRRLF